MIHYIHEFLKYFNTVYSNIIKNLNENSGADSLLKVTNYLKPMQIWTGLIQTY